MPSNQPFSKGISASCALTVLLMVPLFFAPQVQAGQEELDSAVQAAREFIINNPTWSMHGNDQSYDVTDVILDKDGTRHVRFDRRYKNLQVIGGDFVVHSTTSGNFLNATLTLKRQLNLSVVPLLTAKRALELALKSYSGQTQNIPPRLVIYARGDLPSLAWDVMVFSTNLDGTPSEKHVIVDANIGRILDSWDDIHTASALGSGKGYMVGSVGLTTDLMSSVYYLRDPNRGSQYTINMSNQTSGGSIYKDIVNSWGDGTLSNVETVGTDAQFGSAMTWDYYKNILGRLGIANDGKGAYSRVHYGSKYNNAFWSDSCFCMTYGDGDGLTFNPFVALDVAGHEMSHGMTSRTAKLTYSGESGGLNEGTSDIFGTMVEYYAKNANDPGDYLIGEKIYKSGGKALRYMYQPSKDGKSPDCWYSGLGNLNVHYSSGVANHFFYLLAEGTNGSMTCKTGDTLVASGGTTSFLGIGRDKAAKVWYAALTKYMTSSTNYAGARLATISAATGLYGSSSAETNTVKLAWSSVLVK